MTLLEFFHGVYIRENDLEECSINNYLGALNLFERFCDGAFGATLNVADITHDHVNDWLIYYANGRSGNSVKSRKLHLMAVINAARLRQMNTKTDPLRVRRIKSSPTPKDFWQIDDVNKLAQATEQLTGRFNKTHIRKDYYARAYLMMVWDTGLRRADMAVIPYVALTSSLEFTHPRTKTGVTDVVRISDVTYRRVLMMDDNYTTPRKLLFPPWRGGKDPLRSVSDLMNQCMYRAGLTASDSCLKKLVRSSGAEAERNHPGTGWLQMHHSTPTTSYQHYLQRQTTNQHRPPNRSLIA